MEFEFKTYMEEMLDELMGYVPLVIIHVWERQKSLALFESKGGLTPEEINLEKKIARTWVARKLVQEHGLLECQARIVTEIALITVKEIVKDFGMKQVPFVSLKGVNNAK